MYAHQQGLAKNIAVSFHQSMHYALMRYLADSVVLAIAASMCEQNDVKSFVKEERTSAIAIMCPPIFLLFSKKYCICQP